jgi:hypothetical protein
MRLLELLEVSGCIPGSSPFFLVYFFFFYGLSDTLLNFGSGIRLRLSPELLGVSAITHPVLTEETLSQDWQH